MDTESVQRDQLTERSVDARKHPECGERETEIVETTWAEPGTVDRPTLLQERLCDPCGETYTVVFPIENPKLLRGPPS